MKNILQNRRIQALLGASILGLLVSVVAGPAHAQLTGSIVTDSESTVFTDGGVFGISSGESEGGAFSAAVYQDFEALTQVGGSTSAEVGSAFFGVGGQIAVVETSALSANEILGLPVQVSALNATSVTGVGSSAFGPAFSEASGFSEYGAVLGTDGTVLVESVNVTGASAYSADNGIAESGAFSATVIGGELGDLSGL